MYEFTVPQPKRLRVIVDTDCKNEADDQYALMHHLMTPRFDIRAIIATHYELTSKDGKSVDKSYDEIVKVLELSGMLEKYKGKVKHGSRLPLQFDPEALTSREFAGRRPFLPEVTYEDNEASRFIIEEALREDSHPLFVVCLGSLTNVATALLMNPAIADRFTCVWIGGGKYPTGDMEFNLMQDIPAANIVFSSQLALWQVPNATYGQVQVSLAELQLKVRPRGAIGKYLFRQLVEFNDKCANMDWPAGEMWTLGDQPTVTVLLTSCAYDWVPAPLFTKDLYYVHTGKNRPIRVYSDANTRFTLEDFFAKLALNYPDFVE